MRIKKSIVGLFAAIFAVAFSIPTLAQGKHNIVTTNDKQEWSPKTTFGGSVSFVADATPLENGNGAIRLTTDATNEAAAQLRRNANTALSSISELSYFTRQISGGGFEQAAPYYYLDVCLDGISQKANVCNGSTTLIYEPYWNDGIVFNGIWQQWDVVAGQLWSTASYKTDNCRVTAGSGGAPFYRLTELELICPNAIINGFGVGIGSYNPNYVVETDLINFNGSVYDFELKEK